MIQLTRGRFARRCRGLLEELAREIFPIMKRALAEPIAAAIAEWQEIDVPDHRALAPAAASNPAGGADPFPGTFFREHQWNLKNTGQRGGRREIDIRVRSAWEKLGIKPDDPYQPDSRVSVALIDLAVDFEHPALVTLDRERSRNLNYPRIPKAHSGHADRYADAFKSMSSAHAVAGYSLELGHGLVDAGAALERI